MPKIILELSYWIFKEIIVVKVPAPANKGKAIGTILPDAFSMPSSSLKKRIPNIISKPIKNITNDPAIANEEISIPNKESMAEPKNKKLIIIKALTTDAVLALIFKPSFFMLIIIGTLPIISITEKRITVTDKIAVKFISLNFKVSQYFSKSYSRFDFIQRRLIFKQALSSQLFNSINNYNSNKTTIYEICYYYCSNKHEMTLLGLN